MTFMKYSLIWFAVSWFIFSAVQSVVLRQPLGDCLLSIRASTCE